MQTNLNTHQKGLLCWCGQRLCFQDYLCFQIITLADFVYWKSQWAVTNQTISSHDNRIYTSHQPQFLLQSPPLAVDCYILSNSPLVSTHANEIIRHPEVIFPCVASLFHRFLDEFTVERSMLLLTSKTEGECTWSLPLVVTSWRDGNGSPENERLCRKSTALKMAFRLLKWDPNHLA